MFSSAFQISDVPGRRCCEVPGCQMKDMGSCGNACCATRLKMAPWGYSLSGCQGDSISVLSGLGSIFMCFQDVFEKRIDLELEMQRSPLHYRASILVLLEAGNPKWRTKKAYFLMSWLLIQRKPCNSRAALNPKVVEVALKKTPEQTYELTKKTLQEMSEDSRQSRVDHAVCLGCCWYVLIAWTKWLVVGRLSLLHPMLLNLLNAAIYRQNVLVLQRCSKVLHQRPLSQPGRLGQLSRFL